MGGFQNRGALLLAILVLFSSNLYASEIISFQGKALYNGTLIQSGDIEVTVYDVSTGGSPIYNETFVNSIRGGFFDVMIGNTTGKPLNMIYAKNYWIDLKIEGNDIDWEGNERKNFMSGVGNITASVLDQSNINISEFSNDAGYLTTELDTLQTVTSRGSIATANITLNGGFDQRPINPVEVGYVIDNNLGGSATTLDGANNVFVSGGYAYITSFGDEGLSVVDVSDPTNPVEVGSVRDTESGGTATTLDNAYGVFVQGDYAYAISAMDHGLSVIDVSDPTSPVEVGSLRAISSPQGGTASCLGMPFDLFVSGDYVYIASYLNYSLTIVDVSDPTSPVQVGYIVDSEQGGTATTLKFAINVFVRGDYAYVTSQDDNGLSIIDVSDPTNPVEVGYVTDSEVGGTATTLDGASDVFVSGGYAYVTSRDDDGLSVIDVSNPTNPAEVGYIDTILNSPQTIFVSGDYAYIPTDDEGLSIVDISDPTNPFEIDFISDSEVGGTATTLDGPWGVFVSGGYAYIASSDDDGLSIIDLQGFSSHAADIGSLNVGSLDVDDFFFAIRGSFSDSLGVGFGGLKVDGGLTVNNDAFIDGDLNVTGVISGNGSGLTDVPGDGVGLSFSDTDYLYDDGSTVSFNESLLNDTIDARDDDTWWALVARWLFNNGGSLDFNETLLNDTIDDRIPSETDPVYASEKDNYYNKTEVYNKSEIDSAGYLTSESDTLQDTLDRNPNASADIKLNGSFKQIPNPVHLANLSDGVGGALLSGPTELFVSGEYAYIASMIDSALEIVDVTDPSDPIHLSSLSDGVGGAVLNTINSVFVVGDYAYITSTFGNALEIVDVSDPSNPFHVANLSNGVGGASINLPYGLYVLGDYVYIASMSGDALEIVDVSDPYNPVHAGKLNNGVGGALLDAPYNVEVIGNYAYVVSGNSNALEIVDVSDPSNPVHAGSLTHGTGGALLSYPEALFVSGRFAYIASSSSNALEIVDVSDPSNPVHAGSLSDGTDGALLEGIDSVFVGGDYLYFTAYSEHNLGVVDISDPTDPQYLGSLVDGVGGALLSSPEDVFVVGDYVYVIGGDFALEIIKLNGLNTHSADIGSASIGSLNVDNQLTAQKGSISDGLNVGTGGLKVDGGITAGNDTFIDGDLNVTGTIYGDGSGLTGISGDGVGIDGSDGVYLYDDGSTVSFNETKLNATIADLDTDTDTDTWWSIVTRWFFNNSNSLDFNETLLNDTIDARDDDTTYSESDDYLTQSGTVFGFNETELNNTIGNLLDGTGGWNDDGENTTTIRNVGIGTTAPSQELEVNGSINISGGASSKVYIGQGYIYDNGTALVLGRN